MNIFKSWLVDKQIANKGIFDNVNIPENTLPSFEEAINQNYAISFTVHVISDGTVVVFSDSQLSRLTQKDGYLHNLTANDLPHTYILNTSYTIPSLSEVLSLVNNRTPLLIEIVSSTKNVGKDEQRIYNILKGYNGEYAIHSRNPYTLEWFKKNAPHVYRGYIDISRRKQKENTTYSDTKLPSSRHTISTVAAPHFGSFDIEKLSSLKARLFTHQNKPIICICSFACSPQAYRHAFSKSDNVIFEKSLPHI
jgi:glycerophosphoryl diester phosphodiesterase